MKSRTRGPRHLNLGLSQTESTAADSNTPEPNRLRLETADAWPAEGAWSDESGEALDLSVREVSTADVRIDKDEAFDSLGLEIEVPEHTYGHSWEAPPALRAAPTHVVDAASEGLTKPGPVIISMAEEPTHIVDAASEGLTKPGPIILNVADNVRNDRDNKVLNAHYSLSFGPFMNGQPRKTPDQTLAETSMTESSQTPESPDPIVPAPETPIPESSATDLPTQASGEAPLAAEAPESADPFGAAATISAEPLAPSDAEGHVAAGSIKETPRNNRVNITGFDDESLFANAERTPDIIKSPKLRDKAGMGGKDKSASGDRAEILLDEPLITPPPRPTAPVMTSTSPFGSSPGKKDRSKSTATKQSAGTQLVKSPGPGGVLQLSNSSAVTYWGTTSLVSLTWVAGLVAASIGSESGLAVLAFTPFKVALLVLLAVLPLGLIFATAYALRHASRLAVESARAASMADALVGPAAAAASDTASLVAALRDQVDQAVSAVKQAHAEVHELSLKLKSETDLLHGAANQAQTTTRSIAETLSSEREAITRIGESLDAQAKGVVQSVDLQARMVADASDLAQAQLREAEASLTSRAADLSVAASEIQQTARVVSEDLDRQTQRLESAGAGVADQIKIVEDGLSQQRAGLVSAALSLRADQEDFAVHLETQRSQLGDALSVTRGAMVELGDASSRGIDLLREIIVSAQDQLRQVLSAAENERTSFETRIHSTLDNISVMAADARDELVNETGRALEALNLAAEEARRAADSAAHSAQTRVERLNETLFDVGKKADEIFDSRLNSARRLIEDSAALVDEAGARTASRLDEGFVRTRDTIREVSDALEGLNIHAESLPALAKTRIAEIRQTVEDGIRAMTEAARVAAQETEAVDHGFQERVKRNYDMLSEAVRMMGILSGPAAQTPAQQPHNAPPAQNPNPTPPANSGREPARADMRPKDTPTRDQGLRSSDYNRAAETSRDIDTGRSRRGSNALNEPLSHSQASKSVPPQLSQPAKSNARAGDHWSWSDLLKGMEGRGVTADPERAAEPQFDNLDDLMIHEISGMGIDAASLLGRTRMEETIAAILAEDNEGARLAVRRIAPAAVRRLTRRFVTDTQMRDLASQFIAFYDRQINVALLSNDARIKLQEILANDTGRAYLLIDAAISDII